MLGPEFFDRDAATVAVALLGTTIRRKWKASG